METLHQLVRVVARAFYDDKTIVIFDALVRETMLPEDVLIERMQIVGRDFKRIVAKLLQDRLLKSETIAQQRDDQKVINRDFLYIDYKQFVDIVKFRMYKMRHSVEEMIKKEMENKGYQCPSCKNVFSSLDVSRLLNVRTGVFECDICPDTELQPFDALQQQGHKEGPHKLHSRLMEQTAQIVQLLKQADEVTLTAFLPLKWMQEHGAKFSLLSAGADGSADAQGPQLAIAGAKSEIKVELAESDDVLLKANQPASNALPEWHMYSTVTGEAIRDLKTAIDQTPEAEKSQETVEIVENDLFQYYTSLASASEPPSKQAKLSENESASSQEVFVTVAGRRVLLSQVTDEDKDQMTEKEYAEYYEAFMANQ